MKHETKVGLLFLVTFILIAAFAYVLGSNNPFSDSHEVKLLFNFAGGIEEGSPVRAMGIKVGKVKSIEFDAARKDANGEEVKLVVTITIAKKAWDTIREDSRFFINLAGVIGEKYVEITPGSLDKAHLRPNEYYRGEDPPRIDQLLSQSYSLAGKILEMVEKNEGDVVSIIKNVDNLVTNFNKAMELLTKTGNSKNDFGNMIKNLNQISGDVAHISGKLRSKDTDQTIELIHRLLWRLDELDKKAIKKFFQEEGIKAKLF